ncbi:CGNR zinc finger domain-containing protein [Amantichitinum ursilacus]|uniref:CGNR zinc finger n=1 Tax=Amantichitinum ursilacus TaxID=857265 RepID=A0A0N0XG87_9NEIS|nr:ABATE domain-containing protein [Amantichitinum ursilacus]KPC49867.1 CGNR zinc finger [Amantichitinum ursilacus]
MAIAPLFVADHPALDLLNTVMTVDGVAVDTWQSDADVLRWLQTLALPGLSVPAAMPGLLAAARALREGWRELVRQKYAGHTPDLQALQSWLDAASRSLHLSADASGDIQLSARYTHANPAQLLAPLAEAAADLLAHGDWQLVRHCEDHSCSLMFYDRTKAHRRRWCSMAACGNRNKVAKFRQRQQA